MSIIRRIKRRIIFDFLDSLQEEGLGSFSMALRGAAERYLAPTTPPPPIWASQDGLQRGEGVLDEWRGEYRSGDERDLI